MHVHSSCRTKTLRIEFLEKLAFGKSVKLAGTKIAGAQTATSEMTKCRTGHRQNGGAEMEARKQFYYLKNFKTIDLFLNAHKLGRKDM
uniref:Uncharacterized protein n=1 Tax=Romanomermis culicivorax TaxID=13658 RepID=A0A915HG23_ROMCU